MKTPPTKRTPRGLRLAMALSLIVAGVLVGVVAVKLISVPQPFGIASDSRNTQIVKSIERKEEVALVSLGIQGIKEKNQKGEFFGFGIPGSNRAAFIQYNFTAKLGIDGKSVTITPSGANKFLITVPRFIFIGHDNVTFRLAAEDGGVLSWITPKIDNVDMINTILNDDARGQYIAQNNELLRDQTQVFYSSIIRGIDPTITLEFKFSD